MKKIQVRTNSKPAHKHAVSNFRHSNKNCGVKVLSNHFSLGLYDGKCEGCRTPAIILEPQS